MPLLLRAISTLALAVGTFAQSVVDDMSFGHRGGISPNSFAIPGWQMLGEGHVPGLLSDKVMLTPPYGGHKRGALWTEKKNTLPEWEIAFDFRAGGTERCSGSLALWYVNEGKTAVSTASIYTVAKFDGLALVVDTSGGTQKIRGFLNDGTVDYKSHANVDGLAFGHCDYNYRNLGRPSKLQVKSTNAGLEVRIDDKMCFSTAKAVLPTDNIFGMTAASNDPPDSFEVFRFALSPTSSPVTHQDHPQQARQVVPDSMLQMDDTPASQYASTSAQFEDLHNRLNLLSKSITNLFAEITRHTQQEESRFQEILSRLSSQNQPNTNQAQTNALSSLDSRLSSLATTLSTLQRDLSSTSSSHNSNFDKLSAQLAQTHEGVPARVREYMIAHTPRIGFILGSFMVFQTACVGGFVWYKWRKGTMPKKYL